MTANEIIKNMMSDRGITQGKITEMLGMKHQSGVSQALSRDMKTSMLLRFLESMDCELIIRDKKTGTEWVVSEK